MTDTNHGISLASLYWLPTRAFSINNLAEGKRERNAEWGREEKGGDVDGGWGEWAHCGRDLTFSHLTIQKVISLHQTALHEKHYLSTGAIIHRWLPPSQQSATMHFKHWILCMWTGVSLWTVQDVWRRRRERQENKRKWTCLQKDSFIILLFVSYAYSGVEGKSKRMTRTAGGMRGVGGGGGELGWRVNQWISVHPLMSASVNKALISCCHIRWFSSPLGPSWLAEAAHCSLETHLPVYRHLWLVIGSPHEINGTMGAASQPASQLSCAHTHAHTHQ